MHIGQQPYRELSDAISAYRRGALYADVLLPWTEAHLQEKNWLESFARRAGDPVPAAESEDLWRLYALSRVSQILLLRFQEGRADGKDWPGPNVRLDEYIEFMTGLGLQLVERKRFSPFHHEIVEVEPDADVDAPISSVGEFWPCLMLGPMMFSRAGVLVSGGSRHIRKSVAETSTLYWAYRRKNRPAHDLSHGWGSHSQWRTSFRRDYHVGDRYLFNVRRGHVPVRDPSWSLSRESVGRGDGLTHEERIELLIHRCFITVDRRHDDLFPYEDTYTSSAGLC